MAGKISDQDEGITDINITPFVDVMLVLLIIFMIAAPVVYQSGIRVQLPKSTTADEVQHVTLRFFIKKTGEIMLGSETISDFGVLKPKIEMALQNDALADALVVADKDVSHGKVVELVDSVREFGIKQVAIATEVIARGAR